MVVGPGLFSGSDLIAYLGGPRSFLIDRLKASLLVYKVEEKSSAYLEGLQRRILDFWPSYFQTYFGGELFQERGNLKHLQEILVHAT